LPAENFKFCAATRPLQTTACKAMDLHSVLININMQWDQKICAVFPQTVKTL